MRPRTRRMLLLGAIAGAAALAAWRISSASPTTGLVVAGGGELARLHLTLDPAFVRESRRRVGQREMLADVRGRVERLGHREPWAVLQDPTDNRRATVVCRAGGPTPASDGAVRVVRSEKIRLPAPGFRPESLTGLEPGAGSLTVEPWLTPEELRLFDVALYGEQGTRHLKGVASSFEPLAPTAASILRAKATLLDPRREDPRPASERLSSLLADVRTPGPPDPRILERVDELRRAIEGYAASHRIPMDVVCDEVRHAAYVEASGRRGEEGRVPRPMQELGRLLVRPLPRGGSIVDPILAARACPPTGREGYVSGSALWLAHASERPETSGVRDPDAIRERFEDVDGEGDPKRIVERLRARRMLDRAEKTLLRRKWATWYARRPW